MFVLLLLCASLTLAQRVPSGFTYLNAGYCRTFGEQTYILEEYPAGITPQPGKTLEECAARCRELTSCTSFSHQTNFHPFALSGGRCLINNLPGQIWGNHWSSGDQTPECYRKDLSPGVNPYRDDDSDDDDTWSTLGPLLLVVNLFVFLCVVTIVVVVCCCYNNNAPVKDVRDLEENAIEMPEIIDETSKPTEPAPTPTAESPDLRPSKWLSVLSAASPRQPREKTRSRGSRRDVGLPKSESEQDLKLKPNNTTTSDFVNKTPILIGTASRGADLDTDTEGQSDAFDLQAAKTQSHVL